MYVKGSEIFHPEIIGHVIFCTQFARSILLQILRVYHLSMVGVIWGESLNCL